MSKLPPKPLPPNKHADFDYTPIFTPPGRPMNTAPEREQIIVAAKLRVYDSGPAVQTSTGWIENGRIKVDWNTHVMPLSEFLCWWPMPKVKFSKKKKVVE